jgi:hypothetical protein
MKATTAFIVGIVALIVASLTAITIIVALPIMGTTYTPKKDFIQSGTFTWDMATSSSVVVDTLPSTYRLYQGSSMYILELDPPARELVAAEGVSQPSNYMKIRMREFTPLVIPLGSLGWFGYVYPLTLPNVQLITIDGPCFDGPTPTCGYSGFYGGTDGPGGSSFSITTEGSIGYLQFFMQQNNGSPFNWSNYTVAIANTLNLNLWSM